MTLRDLLKKREKINDEKPPSSSDSDGPPPDFTFLRSTTNSQEIIEPPSFANDKSPNHNSQVQHPSRLSRFRSSSNASVTSKASSKGEKRLSARLHIRSHSRESSVSSVNIPADLPIIGDANDEGDREAQWEERATILAQRNATTRSRSSTLQETKLSSAHAGGDLQSKNEDENRPVITRNVSDALGDVRILN